MAVLYDGREIVKSDFTQWRKASEGLPSTPANDIEVHGKGGFDATEFYRAFHVYQNQNIALSIASDDPLIRLFAILDKRVGKRQLRMLTGTIPSQPPWLKPLYLIRMEAEGIPSKNGHATAKSIDIM